MKKYGLIFLTMAIVMANQVLPSLTASQPTGFNEEDYRIGIGDLMQIEVYDEADLSREVRVLTDGSISLPLLGTFKAADLTVPELEQKITKMLGEKYLVNPQVIILVKEFSHVFVFGEVKNPGSFPIYGRLTAFEAITLAGGLTEVASNHVKVIRNDNGRETTYEVDLERLTKKGEASQDVELRANDRVIVSRGFF